MAFFLGIDPNSGSYSITRVTGTFNADDGVLEKKEREEDGKERGRNSGRLTKVLLVGCGREGLIGGVGWIDLTWA